MKSKPNNKTGNRGVMFSKEWETVDRVEEVLNRDSVAPEDVMEEYRYLGRRYQKLVREMKKVTRIGDVNLKKLMDANDQINRQNDELEVLNLQLTEAKATQDKLYSIIAHDLRNPLQFLLFTTDVLYGDYHEMDEETRQSYIQKLFKTVGNMSDLLENLLQWSMSQYGKLECRPHPIKLEELVEEAACYLVDSAEKKSIALSWDIPPQTSVHADEDMLKTVIRNLISNALKFTNAGGTVTVTAASEGAQTVITIADTGIGIPSEKLEILFKIGRTESTDGTAKEKGTGLGLILCKELVEKNQGEMRVTSETGKGSRFDILLPRAQ
jgi:signal transduction histidine kinase